jgi:hypothetical protein
MYLNPQIHDTQDTHLTIHVGYIQDTSGYVSRALLTAALGCALGRRFGHLLSWLRCLDRCIRCHSSHSSALALSRMYPTSQIRTSQDTFEIHVSQYVSWKYSACIPHVSSNHCRYMYLACIPHVSLMYPTCISHVSHVRSSSQVCLP